jgi:hypothetical protein
MDKWIYISAIFSSLIIILIRSYYEYNSIYLLLMTFFCQLLLIYSYFNVFKNKEIVSQYFIVKILAGLLLIVPSIYLFKGELSLRKIIGIIIGIIALFLLA